jgi:hypothetical protein
MKTQTKRTKIKAHVLSMLKESNQAMKKNLEKVLNSGAIDIESWDENQAPFYLPKCILTALLQQESTQWDGTGTSYEKRIKKEVQNIRYFI